MAVSENVGFGYVEEVDNDERIRLATAQSGAAPFIEGLPQKYETTLGRMFEKGHELSIGQWQKMALARAFMRRAPVVVLDEPTSSIDAESEAEIFGRLQEIAAGATTLLIAHRFSTVRMADRIIVIKQGKIIEDGTHNALMLGHAAFAQEAQQRSLLTGGAPLQPTSTATTVRVRNGKTLITDGPFTETKEQLAGIYVLNCKDLDEALEMAARIPDAVFGSIEIRPAMEV